MNEEDRRLLREVHAMLTRLLSKEYEEEQDMKQFCINVAADIYVEDMEEREYTEDEFKNSPRFQHHKNIEQVINMKKMKEFDINLAKQGKPVCTRDGRKARIICFDKKKDIYPLIALVTDKDGYEIITPYKADGVHPTISNDDLMMLPEKKEGYIIVSKNATIYDSLEDAKKSFDSDKELCICKVEWEE